MVLFVEWKKYFWREIRIRRVGVGYARNDEGSDFGGDTEIDKNGWR